MCKNKLTAVDLFAGCGGLSEGLKQAGFDIVASVENNKHAVKTYRLNHPESILFDEDIRDVNGHQIKLALGNRPLHLLAGCPPCQGFSTIRKLNKRPAHRDKRNGLIKEYCRLVIELRPLTIMMENVPGIVNYSLFKKMMSVLKKLGYQLEHEVVNVADYQVPQRRKRLIVIGSLLGNLHIVPGTSTRKTVREAFEALSGSSDKNDKLRNVYPNHTERIRNMITMIPKDGGSRKDLPKRYRLSCHRKSGVGFSDVYGRLKWDTVSSTITGGCLNPSKGRFLHPEENRCISAREAAVLQSFPIDYKFPLDVPKDDLALLIGNALPPLFSRIQAENIYHHIDTSI